MVRSGVLSGLLNRPRSARESVNPLQKRHSTSLQEALLTATIASVFGESAPPVATRSLRTYGAVTDALVDISILSGHARSGIGPNLFISASEAISLLAPYWVSASANCVDGDLNPSEFRSQVLRVRQELLNELSCSTEQAIPLEIAKFMLLVRLETRLALREVDVTGLSEPSRAKGVAIIKGHLACMRGFASSN